MIVNIFNTEKSDVIYKLDNKVFEAFRDVYNRNQQKCTRIWFDRRYIKMDYQILQVTAVL